MSGGHYDYLQDHIKYIAECIGTLIRENENGEVNEWGETKGRFYPPDIIEDFRRGQVALKIAFVYAQRIDWLVSGDDGEDSFRRRLREDLQAVLDELGDFE